MVYQWDVTKCMFSAGNITEKLRVASLDCRGQTVVDLFAGIGYFALPYLLQAECHFLHACEWNPDSVHALKVNMAENGVPESRYLIHEGDNRLLCPRDVADRVNLGLIPTAEMAYETACLALRRESGGILHVHHNIRSESSDIPASFEDELPTFMSRAWTVPKRREWEEWAVRTGERLHNIMSEKVPCDRGWRVELLEIVRVKSYAPKVDHLVLDVRIVRN